MCRRCSKESTTREVGFVRVRKRDKVCKVVKEASKEVLDFTKDHAKELASIMLVVGTSVIVGKSIIK